MGHALRDRDGERCAGAVRTGIGIEIRSGLFPIEHARSLDTWNVTGMRATGSSDFEFDDVHGARPTGRSSHFAAAAATDDPLHAIPLWAQLGSNSPRARSAPRAT